MKHIYYFVKLACQQALDAHETEFVNYNDALKTAQRMYYGNWKTYRQARGHWGPSDEKRAMRFTLPCEAARKIFDTDLDVQRLLVSRDERLSLYRDILQRIINKYSTPTLTTVLQDFLLYCNSQNPSAYKWRASFENVTYTFPGRDTWAIWLSLRDMWDRLK